MLLRKFAGVVACALLPALSYANGFAVSTPASDIGKIPTFHYNITADQMADLLLQDIQEGRSHYSTTKPSKLDQHIVRTENAGNGVSGGGFSTNSGGLICISIVDLYVSLPNSANQGASSFTTRNCAPGGADLWSMWARSTTAGTTGLAKLYANFAVTSRYNPVGSTATNGLKAQAFSSALGVGQELWGTTFFNTWGNTALAQEIVLVNATWR